ncbi:DUF2341 domain-containing protein [Dyadobacter sp. 3J3]|uniref:DUF2341 domain-containing protein n=1 Tax=Dyadobacter sp. 3J3 TaxID=2606600 RepID=UPI0013569E53|nr:DUF2341 domain-containing protein [Dyadobacter sp. 3J3]
MNPEFTFIATIFILLFLMKPENISAETWHLKREIIIDNQGDVVTDVVIKIKLTTNDFNFTKVKTDGADIRFSTSSGKMSCNGLSYWTEQWNENGSTIIWVKIPVLKAKTRNSIFMFYGNSNALSVSDGDKTFLFFDDFEDNGFTKNGQIHPLVKLLKKRVS